MTNAFLQKKQSNALFKKEIGYKKLSPIFNYLAINIRKM